MEVLAPKYDQKRSKYKELLELGLMLGFLKKDTCTRVNSIEVTCQIPPSFK